MSDERATRRWVILFTVVAVPAALGVETLLRSYLVPPEFEEVRSLLGPTMSGVAWVMVLLTASGVAGGIALQQWLAQRAAAKLPRSTGGAVTPRASVGAFLLAASLPQAPAILAAFAFLLGAELLPVVLAVGLSTLGVVVQALLVGR